MLINFRNSFLYELHAVRKTLTSSTQKAKSSFLLFELLRSVHHARPGNSRAFRCTCYLPVIRRSELQLCLMQIFHGVQMVRIIEFLVTRTETMSMRFKCDEL